MKLLNFINTFYIKYVFIILALIFLIVLLILLFRIYKLIDDLQPAQEKISNIKNNLDELNIKKQTVDHTLKTAIPFFAKAYLAVSLSYSILKDFFDTKPAKRSIKKSVKKIYKLRKI